ncbi:hypothetical protein GN956_G18978 [Arapaima gigas]
MFRDAGSGRSPASCPSPADWAPVRHPDVHPMLVTVTTTRGAVVHLSRGQLRDDASAGVTQEVSPRRPLPPPFLAGISQSAASAAPPTRTSSKH